jgi:Protein of unknown function (DUF1638)
MSAQTPLPVVVIACKVFQSLLENYLRPELIKEVTFLDYGLHRVPKNLKKSVQEQIDQIATPSLIVLGYGLCGNGLNGIQAGIHTLLIPRTDDCIAILLGSYDAYLREFNESPGTYYLSKGWLESGSNPLKEYEEYVEKYGAEKANWLMDVQYQNYKRLTFVAHQESDLERYREQAIRVAEFCKRWGMHYQEILGSDRYVRRLAEAAEAIETADGEFIVVQPGGELKQRDFMRI